MTTLADLQTASAAALKRLDDAIPLRGALPQDLLDRAGGDATAAPPRKTHRDLDHRALRLAAAVAERISRDPQVVVDAQRHIERRMRSAPAGERLELQEWQDILSTMSAARLRRFLVQDDARARRLRQSLPFLNVLSDDERKALLGGESGR